jgi:hydroxymethylpyrimidine/phosphomethylpyrimidine kinase
LSEPFPIRFSNQRQLTLGLRGIEADQKVIGTHGCYAMTATTALTAQNTLGVVDIHYTPPDFVRKVIDAVRFIFVAIE